MFKLGKILIIILTIAITIKANSQTSQKDSSYNKEFSPFIGRWNLSPISNNDISNNRFSITGFGYQENREDSDKQPTITWYWGENQELENGDILPISVACPFDTTANISVIPIDSLLNKFSYLRTIGDSLYKDGGYSIDDDLSIKLGSIKTLKFYKTYSANCFEMEIFFVFCTEKKLLYIFSKYGLNILEKLEH